MVDSSSVLETPASFGPHMPHPDTGSQHARPPAPPRQQRSAAIRLRALLQEIWTGCWQAESWPRSAQLRLLSVLSFVGICSWTGIVLSRQSEGVATIWISNGVLFGLLITQSPRRWLAYFFAGLSADTLADVLYGDPFRLAFGVSVANSIEVVLSSLLLTLLFGSPLKLSKSRPLVAFLLISVVGATALTSVLGAWWTLLFVDAGPWWQMFRTWWLGDMLGMAVLAPLIVIVQRPAFFSILQRRHLPHTLLVLLVPTLVAVLIFMHDTDPLIFFLFPALLLVAFRLGFSGTVLNLLLVALIAIGFTIKGHGPLMLITGQHMLLHRIVIAQIFVATGIFTMFPVAALLEEHEELAISLAASEQNFRNLAHADELTGLCNRRAFNVRLEQAWKDALTTRRPLALLLLDADLFKQFNDVYGHLVGDECLRSLAGAISDVVRSTTGIASRFGGEEFAVILPEADRDHSRRIAEAIRRATIAKKLPHPTSPLGIQTVSVGFASLVPEQGQTSMDLVNLADRALYTAKVLGRNQVASA